MGRFMAATVLFMAGTLYPTPSSAGPGNPPTFRQLRLPDIRKTSDVYLMLDEMALLGADHVLGYRIYRNDPQQNGEIPYRMILENGMPVTCDLNARLIRHSAPGAESEEAILWLDARPSVAIRLRLNLTGQAFRSRLQVDGADDRSTWKSLLTGSLLRLPGRGEQTEVLVPPNEWRFLRIRLTRESGDLPRIERATAESETDIARVLEPVPATFTLRHERDLYDPDRNRTEITFGDDAAFVDLVEARFDIAEGKFDRAISVAGYYGRDEDGPRSSHDSRLRRLRPNGDGIVLPLELSSARRLRMTIYNRADAPLTIRSITLYRYRRGLIFSAEPDVEYVLFYGGDAVAEPEYEVIGLPLEVPPDRLPRASLGREVAPPASLAAPRAWSERHPFLLWGALGGTLVVLFLLVLRAMRDTARDSGAPRDKPPGNGA
jgi:hypothetical protein